MMDNKIELFTAIKAGDLIKVNSLLNGEPVLARAQDEQGVSAIMTAVYYGQQQIVKELVGLNPEVSIWEAAATGQVEQVSQLLDKDPSLLNASSPDGYTPLTLAAFFGQLSVLEKLVAMGAEVNKASSNAMHVRPLNSAAAYHNPLVARQMLEILIKNGAQVDAAQSGGFTALHEAGARGEVEMVKLLLRHGADKALKSEDGKTAKDLAREQGHENILSLL